VSRKADGSNSVVGGGKGRACGERELKKASGQKTYSRSSLRSSGRPRFLQPLLIEVSKSEKMHAILTDGYSIGRRTRRNKSLELENVITRSQGDV
jgi:hypothetical protein